MYPILIKLGCQGKNKRAVPRVLSSIIAFRMRKSGSPNVHFLSGLHEKRRTESEPVAADLDLLRYDLPNAFLIREPHKSEASSTNNLYEPNASSSLANYSCNCTRWNWERCRDQQPFVSHARCSCGSTNNQIGHCLPSWNSFGMCSCVHSCPLPTLGDCVGGRAIKHNARQSDECIQKHGSVHRSRLSGCEQDAGTKISWFTLYKEQRRNLFESRGQHVIVSWQRNRNSS